MNKSKRHYRKVKVGDLCLDVEGASRRKGARVITWKCHSGANQKFARTKRGEWKAKHSGKCVNTRTFRQYRCKK